MVVFDNTYTARAKDEINRSIILLESQTNSVEKINMEEELRKIKDCIDFSEKIKLITLIQHQQYCNRLQKIVEIKLKKIRKEEFKEQNINPNDDTITPNEKLNDMRKKESFDIWKDEVNKERDSKRNRGHVTIEELSR